MPPRQKRATGRAEAAAKAAPKPPVDSDGDGAPEEASQSAAKASYKAERAKVAAAAIKPPKKSRSQTGAAGKDAPRGTSELERATTSGVKRKRSTDESSSLPFDPSIFSRIAFTSESTAGDGETDADSACGSDKKHFKSKTGAGSSHPRQATPVTRAIKYVPLL